MGKTVGFFWVWGRWIFKDFRMGKSRYYGWGLRRRFCELLGRVKSVRCKVRRVWGCVW